MYSSANQDISTAVRDPSISGDLNNYRGSSQCTNGNYKHTTTGRTHRQAQPGYILRLCNPVKPTPPHSNVRETPQYNVHPCPVLLIKIPSRATSQHKPSVSAVGKAPELQSTQYPAGPQLSNVPAHHSVGPNTFHHTLTDALSLSILKLPHQAQPSTILRAPTSRQNARYSSLTRAATPYLHIRYSIHIPSTTNGHAFSSDPSISFNRNFLR